MPARNRVPSFQIASGTTNERDNSYNIPTGSIFFNTDTSNIELSGNVVVAGDISATNVVLSGNAVVNGVVISNGTPSSSTDLITKGYADAEYVNDTTAQTIAGVKTFSSVPKTTATPSASTDLIPNWYARSVYGNTNVYVQTNTGGHNIGTGWSYIYNFGPFAHTSNCKIGINYSVPVRNDTQTWGGIITHLKWKSTAIGSTFYGLGETGHTNAMTNAGATIDIVNLNYLLDLTNRSAGNLYIECYHRTYSGAGQINTNQAQTAGDSSSFVNRYQNYAKVIVNVYGT